MAKNLKLKIKNSQLAKAAGLDKLKAKLAGKTNTLKEDKKEDLKESTSSIEKLEGKSIKPKASSISPNLSSLTSEEIVGSPQTQRRIRAKSRSSFISEEKSLSTSCSELTAANEEINVSSSSLDSKESVEITKTEDIQKEYEHEHQEKSSVTMQETVDDVNKKNFKEKLTCENTINLKKEASLKEEIINNAELPHKEKFGPTGKHINHLLAKANIIKDNKSSVNKSSSNQQNDSKSSLNLSKNRTTIHKSKLNQNEKSQEFSNHQGQRNINNRVENTQEKVSSSSLKAFPKKDIHSSSNVNRNKGFSQSIIIQPQSKSSSFPKKDIKKTSLNSEFKDTKANARKFAEQKKAINEKNWYGLSDVENERWRKKKQHKSKDFAQQQVVQRPTQIKVRLPITIKDLAAELKLKAAELIKKMFIHGMTYVLNDTLDDETIVQFIGSEFSCNITIDNSKKEKIQIVSNNIKEEILETPSDLLTVRPPVVAFMGHVDHGKTSLIDAIRKSNRVAGESGSITQHIGAFRCQTSIGTITILDTPGHEAFSAMRARGAEVCDIIVLVLAGDEGIKEQTLEAIEHARNANITILVAINKSDKPNFNTDNVFRQLADVNLLPEAWGGTTITVNTSAKTGEGVSELLEMLALQSEVLELKANPSCRARGLVIESQRHKGLGAVATVLVQNGTLHFGDAVVFNDTYGHIKTMTNENGEVLKEALPSTPVAITGLSDLPLAGDPFIVVKNDKEAKEIVSARIAEQQFSDLQKKKKLSLDKILQNKKVLRLIIRADVQGSIEALTSSIMKINSNKVDVEIVSGGIGEITESDINLAAASKATIIGFHTSLQNHAETLLKNLNVQIKLCDVIYHAIDEIKSLMKNQLDPIFEEKHLGSAEVKAIFKSSQLGTICGCLVIDGSISRNSLIKLKRNQEIIWKGHIASLKRVKEDVREVKKGLECGILLDGYNLVEVGDILETFETISKPQEL